MPLVYKWMDFGSCSFVQSPVKPKWSFFGLPNQCDQQSKNSKVVKWQWHENIPFVLKSALDFMATSNFVPTDIGLSLVVKAINEMYFSWKRLLGYFSDVITRCDTCIYGTSWSQPETLLKLSVCFCRCTLSVTASITQQVWTVSAVLTSTMICPGDLQRRGTLMPADVRLHPHPLNKGVVISWHAADCRKRRGRSTCDVEQNSEV